MAPAAADGDPNQFELALSLAEDSDNIIPAGSEATVRAELRFRWEPPITPPVGLPSYTAYSLDVPAASVAASNLRLGGAAIWDSTDRRRLDIAGHKPLYSRITSPPGGTQQLAKALDGRTLVTRTNNELLLIFDSYTLEHKATINRPAGAASGFHIGFGSTGSSPSVGGYTGSAMALWHESADRAWLFVGSSRDNSGLGRLYIFRLDWSADSVTVTPQGSMQPTPAEANNRHGTVSAWYGATAAFSRDGGTLAVSAPRMNEMGAIYVYSRPDGAGEDWGDITYADGVKVTVAAVPSFGTSTANMPFNPGAAGTCDAWCSRVWSNIAGPGDGVNLGDAVVSLSADGRVLVAGADTKDYGSDTPGGGFTGGNRRENGGDAFVWVAPEGGWANAPRADRDAEGNAKTLIAAQTDATSFRQATHYSPGPLRRWTEPAAILGSAAWPNRDDDNFGAATAVSPDGAVVAVGDARDQGTIHLFQQDSADGWKTFNGGYLTTSSATFSRTDTSILTALISFNFDGTEVVSGDSSHDVNSGRLLIITRPSDGSWASNAARRWQAAPERLPNTYYGFLAHETSGSRVALSRALGAPVYLTGPAMSNGNGGGCTLRTVDGVRTASCPLTLPDSTIVIPQGTPDGSFSISGVVAVQLGSGDPVTLRDTLEVTIGEVDELAQVEFDFDTDAATGRPQPAVVEPGGSTTLLLKLLNENGKASAKGAAAAVLLTATRGSLSARLGSASGEACATGGAPSACKIADATTALTAANTDQIRLTLTHPGAAKAGTARVWAVVSGATGETFETEQFTVTFSGPPAALAISQPATALLGYDPGESADQRNAATLVVSATDAGDNKATVPSTRYSAKLTDSDGKTVAGSKAGVVWPLRAGDAADGALLLSGGNPQARVTIAAGRSAPLASGEYTLELSAGSGRGKLTATQTVVVTGGAAEVALSADPTGAIELDGSVTLTATVSDSSGAPVPDGTPVTFAEQSTGTNVTLVLLSQSEQRTRDGQASATLRAVGVGGAYVTAEADGVSGAQSIMVAAPPPPPLDPLVGLTVGTFNTWIGSRATTASELYAQLEGVARLIKWDGIEWIGYGETDGLLNSGSVDFAIERGDVLWLDGE